MIPQKILLVDDEKSLTERIREGLLLTGNFNVERACNGQEAVEKYQIFHPDIVVMDVEMPIMDGYDSSSRIKSIDPNAKILMLTGNPGGSRARKTITEGIALTILEKPVRIVELSRIIRKNLLAPTMQ